MHNDKVVYSAPFPGKFRAKFSQIILIVKIIVQLIVSCVKFTFY